MAVDGVWPGCWLSKPATALVPTDGIPAALLVERSGYSGQLTTDGGWRSKTCPRSWMPARGKYRYHERIAGALRPLSTDAEADLLLLLKRALFAWLIADGDMHLKNMAVLKIADPGARGFTSVRLAPLYDAVTTRVFPNLEYDRMALKMSGKDERLKRADFRRFAVTAEIPAAAADAAMTT